MTHTHTHTGNTEAVPKPLAQRRNARGGHTGSSDSSTGGNAAQRGSGGSEGDGKNTSGTSNDQSPHSDTSQEDNHVEYLDYDTLVAQQQAKEDIMEVALTRTDTALLKAAGLEFVGGLKALAWHTNPEPTVSAMSLVNKRSCNKHPTTPSLTLTEGVVRAVSPTAPQPSVSWHLVDDGITSPAIASADESATGVHDVHRRGGRQ